MKKLLSIFLCLSILLCGCQSAPAPDLDTVLDDTAAILLERVPEPGFGTVGGEWTVYGMALWGGSVPKGWFEGYESRLAAYVEDCGGVLHEKKYTEYSRVVLALTTIGGDARDVAGYDLTAPLMNYDQTIFQGITGAVYALLALDSGVYGTDAIREQYIAHLLELELSGGGWCLTGDVPDPDLTAMTLQALAPYRDREAVKAASDRGVETLAEQELTSCESIAQAIMALSAMGIDPADARFTREGRTLTGQLLQYRTEDGMFSHLAGDPGDLIATEQAFYALAMLNQPDQ